MSGKSKKSKMTDEEYAEYVRDAESAVQQFTNFVDGTMIMYEGTIGKNMESSMYSMRALALGASKTALAVIQDPKEVGDYHQPSLQVWRAQIRRLDPIAEAFLKTLYPKKYHG